MTFEFEIPPGTIAMLSAMAYTGTLVVLVILLMLIWIAYGAMLGELQAVYTAFVACDPRAHFVNGVWAFVLLIAWAFSPLYYPVYGVVWLLTYPITRGKL